MPTREQVKELLPILQAYVAGKVIQLKHKDKWLDVAVGTELSFNNDPSAYRVKPDPVTRVRPFTLEEFRAIAPRLHWVKRNDFGVKYTHTMVVESYKLDSDQAIRFSINSDWWSLESCLDLVIVNPDGTEEPFGAVEEVTE